MLFLYNLLDETLLTLIDLKDGLEMMYFEDCKQTINFKDDLEGAVEVLQIIKEDVRKRTIKSYRKYDDGLHKL